MIGIETKDLDGNAETIGGIYCSLGTRVRFSSGFTTEGWVEITNVPGYKYAYFVDRWGVTQSSIVDVYFSTAIAATGNFAPFVTTGENLNGVTAMGFIIYAKEKPNAAVVFSYDVEF